MDFDEYIYYMRDDDVEEEPPEFSFPFPQATMDWTKDIRRRTLKDGSYQIWCKLGLWKVVAPTREQAEREAYHYWLHYKEDDMYGKVARYLANQVCDDCGSHLGTYVAGESTWHVGTCDVCHQEKPVTEARDYNYLHKAVSKCVL
jgi:hypothetical protein